MLSFSSRGNTARVPAFCLPPWRLCSPPLPTLSPGGVLRCALAFVFTVDLKKKSWCSALAQHSPDKISPVGAGDERRLWKVPADPGFAQHTSGTLKQERRCTQYDMAVPLHNLIEEISRITQTVNYSSAKRPSINYLA